MPQRKVAILLVPELYQEWDNLAVAAPCPSAPLTRTLRMIRQKGDRVTVPRSMCTPLVMHTVIL